MTTRRRRPDSSPALLVEPSLLRRGVFIAPFLSRRGCAVLLAIDSKHRERRRKELGPRADRREQMRILQGLLDLLDPRQ